MPTSPTSPGRGTTGAQRPDIRCEPGDIDASWLSAALEAAGVARGAEVTELEFTGYVGTGQMSRNGRFRLTWSEPAGRPSTVVAKFPSDDPSTRAVAFQSGTYHNEHVFYTEIAPTVRVTTPACWVARYDENTQRCILVMEDMHQSEPGDQLSGCSLDQADLVIEEAVGLHAPRWGDPSLAQQLGLGRSDEDRAELLTEYYRAAVEVCLGRIGDRLDGDVTALVEQFIPVIGPWTARTDTPPTVVHGDFRPDNLLFGRSPDAPATAVVDWQTVSQGLGITDVAYFLAGAYPVELRRTVEADLVEQYRQQLDAAGVSYAKDDCWRDYRWTSLHGVMIAVLATLMATQTERGDDLFALMIDRHARHALDHEALDLVRG